MNVIDWQGYRAYQLETEAVRVVVIPRLGCKIVSLQNLATGYEWLALPTRPLKIPTYAAPFTDYDLSGWDEMFPTLNACTLPGMPSQSLPDHGEVWALPWDVIDRSHNTLVTRVVGQHPDYRYTLTRKASLQGETLRLEHDLQNHAEQDLPFLWAAHPLFRGDTHTVIQLPETVLRVINVVEHPEMGSPGRELGWPVASLLSGRKQQLDRMQDAVTQDYRKVYTQPTQPVATAGLLQTNTGDRLQMQWDATTMPYLGVWIDEGAYTHRTTVALEPASGYYDSLALAVKNQRVSSVPRGGGCQWWLTVSLSTV